MSSDNIALRTNDYVIYLELISFYERNKRENDLGDLFNDLFENKTHIIGYEKNIFYRKYFLYLFRNKKIQQAIIAHSILKPDDLEEELFIWITAETMFLAGDFKRSAIEFEKIYTFSKNMEHLFNSLISYMKYNDIKKAEEIAKQLIYKNFSRRSTLYAAYSNIEVLKNNIEKAYEYAKMAKDFDKENPYSDTHPFYIGRSIRCGKEEGTAYVCEFASNYPKHDKWLKGIKALEKDEAGNDIPTKEFMDFLNSQSKRFNSLLSYYSNRKIGISALAKAHHETIPEILNWRYYYKIRISITSGMIQEVSSEITNLTDSIVIDAFGLYILSEIGYLDILKQFKKVYITYSTLESLQLTIMSIEDANIRKILDFIDGALNTEIVCPDYDIALRLKEKLSNFFFNDQIDSAVYSRTKDLTYIYCDHFFKAVVEDYNSKFMSIVAFIRVLLKQGFINKETLSDIVLILKKYKYDFINFDSEDIYNVAKKSNFEMNKDIYLFFGLDRHCDMSSFVFVYINFFKSIYGIDREKFDKYVDIYIDLFDKYTRKTRYYFHLLEMLNPDNSKAIRLLQEKCSLPNLVLFQDSYPEDTNSYEFERIKHIFSICIGALRLLLNIFKDKQEDYDYYSQKLRSNIQNITKSDIEYIIKNAKNDSII